MKKLFLAGILALSTVAVVQAQDSSTPPSDRAATPTDQQQPQAKEGKDITAADLPAPVQDKLRGSDYSGWTVEKAKTKMKDGKTCYAVELKNGSDKKKVVFDEQGNIVKEKE